MRHQVPNALPEFGVRKGAAYGVEPRRLKRREQEGLRVPQGPLCTCIARMINDDPPRRCDLSFGDSVANHCRQRIFSAFAQCSILGDRITADPLRQLSQNVGCDYLIDLKHAVIMDVEATTAVRQVKVTAQRVMLDRTQKRFGLWPERLDALLVHK